MNRLKEFVKRELVLLASLVLCLGSMLIVRPSADYIGYIDFRTLGLLLSLMTIMAGLGRLGVFRALAEMLLSGAKSSHQLYFVLVLLCFFSSMVITNDVALITFVPFTIVALRLAGQEKRLIYIVSMETIAANLGSMLTPIGNPQNLYLFSFFNMSAGDFVGTVLPYSLLSLAMLVLGALPCRGDEISASQRTGLKIDKRLASLYCVLLVLALLSVFRVLDYRILVAIVLLGVLLLDRKALCKVDYSLLLTFVFLFVFIGNLSKTDAVSGFLRQMVEGNEVIAGVLSSQVLSNVPACILLSGFTGNAPDLLIGVSLGGLGTLIASMASLISFKLVQRESKSATRYLLCFTALNIIFLFANLLLWMIIK